MTATEIKEMCEQSYHNGYMDALDTLSREVAPELAELESACSALRAELIEVLTKAASCREHDAHCEDCISFHNGCDGCPSKLTAEEALRRLEVLQGD